MLLFVCLFVLAYLYPSLFLFPSLYPFSLPDADTSLSSGVLLHVDPPSYSATLHNEVFLDLDSESSSDDDIYRQQEQDYLEVVGRESGAGPEEDNLDTVYPFAWALDGRRIGENGVAGAGRAESPNSISAMSMVRYCSLSNSLCL